ncbi:MAG: hypothetical protein LIP28_00370 [Deltaproteobacteria bacterium]|nr:hypothetical protein [Deltaproteobacteria bacterium]
MTKIQTNKQEEPFYPKAFWRSMAMFSLIFMLLFYLAIALCFGAIEKIIILPRYNAIMFLAAGGFFMGTISAAASVLLTSQITPLLFRAKIQRALPLPLIMNWYNLTGPRAVIEFIREKNLDVYISKTQSRQEVENLECGLLPLYCLPVYFPGARAMLRAFHEIYFDHAQFDEAMDRELQGIHNAAPEKLLAYGTTEQKAVADAVRSELKEKGNRGYAGRIALLMKRNHFLTAHTIMVVKLTQHFTERWAKRKNRPEPIISHESIQAAEMNIRDADPELAGLLMEKCIRNNPNLPDAMRDMFRYAMPEEMVHWPGGKRTLAELAATHLKDAKIENSDVIPETHIQRDSTTSVDSDEINQSG